MTCCLNPDCSQPLNPDGTQFCVSCGAELPSLLRGRYRVIEPLGGGGFARTYLAEDIDKLNEPCAVKQLVPQVQGSWSLKKATELFQQEAKRLQQLGEHRQIPTLYAYFQEDGYLYLVQQFIEGQNLLQELKQYGVFDETKIRAFLSDLLPVIAMVHQEQVIHRDIKPENILRSASDGKLVLIDFGGSKLKTATVNAKPGTYIGSMGYAPLEQMQKGEAYPASDFYSLGVTCFYLLTNVSPSDLWVRGGYGWVSSWRQYLTQPISYQLGQILDRLLQLHHELRYQSAEAILQDLNTPTPSQHSPLTSTIVSSIQPLTLPSQLSHQPTKHLPQLSVKEILPQAVLTGSGSSFLAIALVSFFGTIWSSGLWLLILGGFIFAQSRPIIDKTYLFSVAGITTLLILFVYQNLSINLLQAGQYGGLVLALLVILGGLLAFILMGLSQLLNRLFSHYF